MKGEQHELAFSKQKDVRHQKLAAKVMGDEGDHRGIKGRKAPGMEKMEII